MIPGNNAKMIAGRTYRWCIIAVWNDGTRWYGHQWTFTVEDNCYTSNVNNCHLHQAGLSDVSNIYVYIQGTSWGGAATGAVTAWNNISPNVKCTQTNGSAQVRMIIDTTTSTAGVTGVTELYANGTKINSSDWNNSNKVATSAVITLYEKAHSILYGANTGHGYNMRYRTAVHEVGHSLGLAHLLNYYPLSVMTQSGYNTDYLEPNYIDRIHLRKRRGF